MGAVKKREKAIVLLPPKHLLESWRASGLSPQQIYERCKEMSQAHAVKEQLIRQRPGWPQIENVPFSECWRSYTTDHDLAEMASCEACNEPKPRHKVSGRGMCHKHYMRLYMRRPKTA